MGELLRRGLEEENHTVTLARDGLEGLQVAETCNIDAIVLDVMVPELNGIEVAKRLRSAGRQVPILMLTARDAAADVVKGLDAGADDYLAQPFARTLSVHAITLPVCRRVAPAPWADRSTFAGRRSGP